MGKGGSGNVLEAIVTHDIPQFNIQTGTLLALKYCNNDLYICDPLVTAGSKIMRQEIRILIANNCLCNHNICDNMIYGLGIFPSCHIFDDHKEILGSYTSKVDEVNNNGGMITIMQHISGRNLINESTDNVQSLLQNNPNIIFEMLYAASCCYLSLGYIQSDVHPDNMMISDKSKYKKTLYNIAGQNVIMETNIKPYIIDFGASSFREDIKASDIFRWCYSLIGTQNVLNTLYPHIFKSNIRELNVKQLLLNLPDLFPQYKIDIEQARIHRSNTDIGYFEINDEKIASLSRFKELLVGNLRGGNYMHKYEKYKKKYLLLKNSKFL